MGGGPRSTAGERGVEEGVGGVPAPWVLTGLEGELLAGGAVSEGRRGTCGAAAAAPAPLSTANGFSALDNECQEDNIKADGGTLLPSRGLVVGDSQRCQSLKLSC